jgi:transaldolase
MELYLDSVSLEEIKKVSTLGYITGLTTTPTFMHRDGITDIDGTILNISKMVNILQVEALGDNAEEIVAEAHRLLELGLDPKKTVFKIPISMEGTRACKMLVNEGLMVNLHLVYTLQQAYMAFCAGATYVCPLVGRLQDQGHDALGLVEQCVNVTEKYNYNSKIMFSSVRYVEHVKNALNIGVHTCTVPWKVMKQLTENHFTEIGTQQFVDHTRHLTTTVGEIAKRESIHMNYNAPVVDALVQMSKSKSGAVIVLNDENKMHRIFTDGDLRRLLEEKKNDALTLKLSDLDGNAPHSIDSSDSLLNAAEQFKTAKVDCFVVMENGSPVGLVDIQDVI